VGNSLIWIPFLDIETYRFVTIVGAGLASHTLLSLIVSEWSYLHKSVVLCRFDPSPF